MKRKAKIIFLVLFAFTISVMAGCGSTAKTTGATISIVCGSTAETTGGDTSTASFEKHTISYPDGYDTTSAGASCYDGADDHFNSPYFSHLDFYNMTSTDTLTIIPQFKAYQQTTDYTCGASTALMVMNHYGDNDYDELTIAQMAGATEETGISPQGLAGFFKEIGWNVESSVYSEEEYTFEDPADFRAWVLKNLGAGTPIMVDWLDWAGHWQAIIGYDTMGTDDNFGDDVIIFADPYDTSDQYQDGYYIFSAERFFYMWQEGPGLSDVPQQQPWIIATPAK
jgi:hypothetical protein